MQRHRPSLLLATAVFAVAFIACSSQKPAEAPDTRAADETAIRTINDDWGKAIAAKDLDKTVAPYADDAVLFAPKAPASVGKDSIRKSWQGLLAVPNLQLTFAPSSIDVARSGDLAVERGSFQVVTTDKKGKQNTETGQLVIGWKKQVDGSWKVTADCNADDK